MRLYRVVSSQALHRSRAVADPVLFGILVLVFLVTPAVSALAQSGEQLFVDRQCGTCHTIGGGHKVGPDLAGVEARVLAAGKDREWLINYIDDPVGVMSSGDEYIVALKESLGGAIMLDTGVSRGEAEALLEYINAASGVGGGPTITITRALTEQDTALGRRLFTGATPLSNGGPACISCHSTSDAGLLGGGQLGPDLTEAYDRLGQSGVANWIFNPDSQTMAGHFARPRLKSDPVTTTPVTDAETIALVAYLKQQAEARGGLQQVAEPNLAERLWRPFLFLLVGGGATVVLLFFFHVAWIRRFRSVRAALVDSARY